jgi:hypothetical protein
MATASTIPFYNPADKNQQASAVALMRAQLLAQSLQKNAEMPAANDMAGQVVYRHSPLEYLARGASGALAQSTQSDALQKAADLQSQQAQALMSSIGGQTAGSGTTSSGIDPYKIALASNIYGPEAGKAIADDMQRTNEMKNAGASGQSTPLDYANALAGGSARAGAVYGKPIEKVDPNNPTGPVTLVRPDIAADQLGATPAPPAPPAPQAPAAPFGVGGNTPQAVAQQLAPSIGQLPPVDQMMTYPPGGMKAANATPVPNPVAMSQAGAQLSAQSQIQQPLSGPQNGPSAPIPPVSQSPMSSPAPTPQIPSNIDPSAQAPMQASAPNQTASPAQIEIAKAKAMAPIEAGKAGQTTDVNNAMNYKNGLIGQVSEGEKAMNIINTQEALLDKFKSGAWTTDKANIASMAASMGAPQSVVQGIAGGDPAAIQAFEGLSAQHALLQLKSMMGQNGRIGQNEFKSFQRDLANPNKMDGAIRSINNMQRTMYGDSVNELGALQQWEQQGKPITQFRENYSQQRAKSLLNPPNQSGLPSGATKIGTSGGKAVYQLPDGSHVMEE